VRKVLLQPLALCCRCRWRQLLLLLPARLLLLLLLLLLLGASAAATAAAAADGALQHAARTAGAACDGSKSTNGTDRFSTCVRALVPVSQRCPSRI
jgi:hypothetical protein